MKIAIVGGGASGMVTAYLLDRQHQVIVYEKQPILGGNIRTINKNVLGVAIDKKIKVDNGVIEFEEHNFVYFHRLMKELEVTLCPVPGTTGLFLANGRCHLSPYGIRAAYAQWWRRGAKYLRSIPVAWGWQRLHKRSKDWSEEELYQHSMGDLLRDTDADKWIRMLLMYCYSIPYAQIDQVPAVLGVPIIRDYWRSARWNRIQGGVYCWEENCCNQFLSFEILHKIAKTLKTNRKIPSQKET